VGLFSYGDRVRASVVGDKVYFPNCNDVQFIADSFQEVLISLGKEVDLPDDLIFCTE